MMALLLAPLLAPGFMLPTLRPRAPPARALRMGLLDDLGADSLLKLDAALTRARLLKSFDQRPERIILVRHGESEGNVNTEAYGKAAKA